MLLSDAAPPLEGTVHDDAQDTDGLHALPAIAALLVIFRHGAKKIRGDSVRLLLDRGQGAVSLVIRNRSSRLSMSSGRFTP
jgi:hypothetical protein